MINPFIFTKKEDIVVLDIRDGSVGGMILSLDKDGKNIPEKIFSIRKEIPFQRNFNHKRLFYATSQAMVSVSTAIARSGFRLPKKIFCVVSPHLHASQVRVIKSKYDKPITVSESLLKTLVLEDIKQFENKHLDLGGDSSNAVLEHKIMQIKLNGYETDSPIKKVASEIEISVFVSMVPKILLYDLRKIIFKNLHSDIIDFHSFTFVLSDVIRGVSLDKRGFAVIDVEDEISEISVIRNGVIEDTASFPVGMSIITRIVMDRFGISHEQAISYLKLFTSRSGESEIIAKMSDVVERARVIWSDLFYQSLKKISYHHLLPDTFYIATDEVCKDVFLDFITRAEVSSLLVMNKPPRIECLEPKVFAGLCKNISACPDDLHLLAAAVFSDKVQKQSNSSYKKSDKDHIFEE